MMATKNSPVFKVFKWDGNNLDELKENFPDYDIYIKPDGRLSADLAVFHSIGSKDDVIPGCHCDIGFGDTILKNTKTGEVLGVKDEVFLDQYSIVEG